MLMLITHPTNAAKNGCARATWAWTSSLALWAVSLIFFFFFFFSWRILDGGTKAWLAPNGSVEMTLFATNGVPYLRYGKEKNLNVQRVGECKCHKKRTLWAEL
jgi:hypothetical protein